MNVSSFHSVLHRFLLSLGFGTFELYKGGRYKEPLMFHLLYFVFCCRMENWIFWEGLQIKRKRLADCDMSWKIWVCRVCVSRSCEVIILERDKWSELREIGFSEKIWSWCWWWLSKIRRKSVKNRRNEKMGKKKWD